jgi:acetyl esterase
MSHTATQIPVRVYHPESYHPGKQAILIFYHGGGWVLGSCDSHHDALASIAQITGCAVASVEYRLAPDHKFPAAVQDALSCTEWLFSADNRESVGLPQEMIVGIGGDSAGGNLAAVVTHELKTKHPIAFQVLIYPATDFSTPTESQEKYATGYLLTKSSRQWFRGHYLSDDAQAQDPKASPMLYRDFSNLPPCLLIVAECDPLYDETIAYGNKMEEWGVSVERLILGGLIHAFFNAPGCCPESCSKAYRRIAEFIHKHI